MAVFSECQITLELDSSLPFKGKLELKRKIIDNGGVISFIVTKKVRRSIDNRAGRHVMYKSATPTHPSLDPQILLTTEGSVCGKPLLLLKCHGFLNLSISIINISMFGTFL